MDRYSYSRNGELGRVDEKCLVRVQIPSVDSGEGGKVRYHVRVTNVRTRQSWEVARRFSEFLKLRNELVTFFASGVKKCPGCINYEKVLLLFEFPRKHVFTSVTPVVINYRKKALRSFVALLASHTFTTTPKCPTCSGFPFTGVRDWLTSDLVLGGASAGTDSAGNSPTHETIRDTMNVKDFINSYAVSNDMPVDSEGRFTTSGRSKAALTVKKPRPSRPQVKEQSKPKPVAKEDPLLLPSRSSDGASSTASSDCAPSPPSTVATAMSTPAPAAVARKSSASSIEEEKEEEDDEAFSSFVMSSAEREAAKDAQEQPAKEPLPVDDAAQTTKEKKHFKFTRSSSARASMELRDSSMIDMDSLDGDDKDEDDKDEDVNLDFMGKASLAAK